MVTLVQWTNICTSTVVLNSGLHVVYYYYTCLHMCVYDISNDNIRLLFIVDDQIRFF